MTVQSLKKQILREFQASGKKTALLALLLCFGLYFWLPPLYRSLSGRGKTAAVSPAPADKPSSSRPPVEAEASLQGGATGSLPGSSRGLPAWERLEKLGQTDPLIRSAEVSALRSEPFLLNHDQFPPPVLFADDPPPAAPVASARDVEIEKDEAPSADKPPPHSRLVLTSTLVGQRRRAAFINSRLYFEGAEMKIEGETYRLISVFPRRALLVHRNHTFELRIPKVYTTSQADPDSPSATPDEVSQPVKSPSQ